MKNLQEILIEDENAQVSHNDGITFIARKVPGAPKFSVAALMEAGSFDDVVSGTAHFFEHLPFGKTENFEDEKIFAYMLERGGSIGAYTTRDRTVYYGDVQKGAELDALLAVSDLVCRPVMVENRVLTERETILDEWAFNEMDAGRHFYKMLTKAAYGQNESLLPVIGTDETIMQIGLSEVQSFFKDNYFADRLTVAMEGDFDPEQVIDWAKEKFRLPRGPKRQSLARIEISPQTHILPTDQRATKTSVIFQGRPSVLSQKEMAECFLLGRLLFGISGPVMKEMRFGKRLVYGVGVGQSDYQTNYAFDAVTFDAFPAKVPAAVESMGHSINNFLQSPDDQLFKQIVGESIRNTEDSLKRNPEWGAQAIAYAAYARGIVEPKRVNLETLQNIRVEDVASAGVRYLSNGKASVLYMGQHRENFPDHDDVISLLKIESPVRTATTDVRVTGKGSLEDSTKTPMP